MPLSFIHALECIKSCCITTKNSNYDYPSIWEYRPNYPKNKNTLAHPPVLYCCTATISGGFAGNFDCALGTEAAVPATGAAAVLAVAVAVSGAVRAGRDVSVCAHREFAEALSELSFV